MNVEKKSEGNQSTPTNWTINLYALTSLGCFSILYSKYFSGINPISIEGHSLYVHFSFWLHFTGLSLLVIAFAKLIFRLTRKRPTAGFVIVGAMSAILTAWIYIDSQLYALLNIHTNRFILEALLQKDALKQIGLSPSGMISSAWPLFVFLLPHALIKYLSNFRIAVTDRRQFRYFILVTLVALPIDKIAYGYFYFNAQPFVFELKNSSPIYPTPHPYYILSFFQRITGNTSRMGFQGRLESETIDSSSTSKHITYPIKSNHSSYSIGKPYNIIFVIAESLRASDFNISTAPQISALGLNEIQAQNHFSSGNCTHFGLFSLFYGLNPYYFHDFRLSKQPPVGVQLLRENGYDIYATLSRTMQWYDLDKFMFGPTFSAFQPNLESSVESDRAVTDKAISIAQQYNTSSKRYLNFVYYYATHADYQHPDEISPFQPELKGRINFADQYLRDKRGVLINRYKNSIRFIDHEVNRLIGELKKSGAWDNTIVVFTGDHGEEFFEDNKYGHNSGLNTYQTHVPFIMHVPGHAPVIVNKLTSHLDVFQTILDMMQSPPEIQANYQGTNLLTAGSNPVTIGMAHYQRPQSYAILNGDRRTIIDLADGAPRLESVTDLNGNRKQNISLVESDVMFLLRQIRQLRQ